MNKPIQPTEIAEQAQLLATGLKYDYNTLLMKLHFSVRPKFADSTGTQPLPRWKGTVPLLAIMIVNISPGFSALPSHIAVQD
jgi:hypothetical protein